MSQSPSGSNDLDRSFVFEITDESNVGEVRRRAQDIAVALGFSDIRATRLSIIANELTTNLSRHAKQGQVVIRGARQFDETFVELISIDAGPGIGDLTRAFVDGVTSGVTPGTGLGAIRRQSDIFDIISSPRGTVSVSEIHATDESAERAKASRFRVSGICDPIHGEKVCGDAWVVRPTDQGFEIMVADGLGHGPIAHLASSTAVEMFNQSSPSDPLDRKLQILHGALRSTRGAAVSFASLTIAPDTFQCSVDFTGVGNVRGVICERVREKTLVTHAGTVGLQFKPHPVLKSPWSGDGSFVMHSDGLQQRWTSQQVGEELFHHPGILVGTLFRDFNRGTDDVTVVAASFYENRNV